MDVPPLAGGLNRRLTDGGNTEFIPNSVVMYSSQSLSSRLQKKNLRCCKESRTRSTLADATRDREGRVCINWKEPLIVSPPKLRGERRNRTNEWKSDLATMGMTREDQVVALRFPFEDDIGAVGKENEDRTSLKFRNDIANAVMMTAEIIHAADEYWSSLGLHFLPLVAKHRDRAALECTPDEKGMIRSTPEEALKG